MEYQVVLDSHQYQTEGRGSYVLYGWIYAGSETPTLQVRFGHREIPFTVERVERPDVLKAYSRVQFPDQRPGFRLVIPDMDDLLCEEETLRVRAVVGDKRLPVLQRSTEELRTEKAEQAVLFYLEREELRRDQIYLQGWCVCTEGTYEMQLLDEQGTAYTEYSLTEMRRGDLADAFHTDLSCCHGFAITLPRSQVTGRELVLRFSNGSVEKQHSIDMKRFDRENRPSGKVLKLFRKGQRRNTLRVLTEEGLEGLYGYLVEESLNPEEYYAFYAKRQEPSKRELRRQASEAFSPAPLFSIVVPLYQTPLPYLKDLIDSVLGQSYANWQLCLADGSRDIVIEQYIRENYGKDRRISYRHLEDNTGISGNTNEALAMADGDYIVFADHDDTLTPDALYENMLRIRDYPDAELLYSDEDLMDAEGRPYDPHFKPDFNLDYLRSINYICHLVVVKRSLYEKVGNLNSAYDGAQDYDFVLRCVEQAKAVCHIPKVLYHWRSHSGSTAGNEDSKQYAIDAGRHALEAHYERMGLLAEVTYTGLTVVYDTKYQVTGSPLVSILIPNKDHVEDLDKCLSSIAARTDWKRFEVLLIENNSTEPETFVYYEQARKRWPWLRVIRYGGDFNYSAINNLGARFAEGEYYVLLNNDTEVITEDWLTRMLGYCQRKDVGIVGAKLFYPDNTLQHGGVVIGIGGIAGHIEVGQPKEYSGVMRRLSAAQDISAVTAACLMVKAEVFRELHGLSENLAVAFNDVDFCLRAREAGYLVVYDPAVQLYHYESKSRGYETTPEKIRRFQKEIDIFKERHQDVLEHGDPYYNPNLSLMRGDCAVVRLQEARKGRNA